jgi:hypothetical protein
VAAEIAVQHGRTARALASNLVPFDAQVQTVAGHAVKYLAVLVGQLVVDVEVADHFAIRKLGDVLIDLVNRRHDGRRLGSVISG